MPALLEGKAAVITGGATGIGLATTKKFVVEGAHVFVLGRRKAELEAAVRTIGRQVTAIQGDVTKLSDLDWLYSTVKASKGNLDIVFANAAIAEMASLEQVSEEHIDRQFDINVKGTVFTVQKALPLLGRGASIVVNASISGIKGEAGLGIYAATNAAADCGVFLVFLIPRDRTSSRPLQGGYAAGRGKCRATCIWPIQFSHNRFVLETANEC